MLVQEDIYDKFMEKVVARTEAIKTGDPLDPATMMWALRRASASPCGAHTPCSACAHRFRVR